MPKEILLYKQIESNSASEFITAMDEASDSDICLRISSNGGNPDFGFGMIAKFREHKKGKLIKVDGKAHSMVAFFLCYSDDNEALEVAEFVIHRAAYPKWFEDQPELFTEDVRANVERINSFLRKALEAKIDVAKFEVLKNVKMKDIFSLDSRIDVSLTAAEAKKIGLINRIIKITPEKSAEIKSLMAEINAQHLGIEIATTNTPEIIKPENMTIEKLKAEHPTLFAQVVAMGIAQEKDRVEACLVFIDIDPVGVKAAIETGNALTAKAMAEFGLKAMSKESLSKIAAESTASVTTGEAETPKSEKEKAVATFEAIAKEKLGLK